MKNRLFRYLLPPEDWRLPVIIILGIFAGIAFLIVHLARADSYLSDNPRTCVNCHIMSPQYATWSHSSHRQKTTCNDCHVPHRNKLESYFFKAKDGMRHASVFTMRMEPQVIFIKRAGIEVVQQNCIRCHHELITDSKMLALTEQTHSNRTSKLCWECHREVPHGRVNSLSSVPYARVPLPESPVPEWMKLTDNTP